MTINELKCGQKTTTRTNNINYTLMHVKIKPQNCQVG